MRKFRCDYRYFHLWNIIVMLLFSAMPLAAQEKWEWPEHPLNLTTLPSDLTASELREAMKDFTSGLGVRCNYCHVGEEGKPFSTWDFAADDKPNKERAREMIRMLGSIDEHLAKIKPSGETRVNMICFTCHRGRPRPMTLNEEITEAYRKNGLQPAIAHLSELKEKYYGKGIYNFEDVGVLTAFGKSLLDSSKSDEALTVFQLNVEKFPQSSWAWSAFGDGQMKTGNKEEAINSFEKALELDSHNRYAKGMLDKLKN